MKHTMADKKRKIITMAMTALVAAGIAAVPVKAETPALYDISPCESANTMMSPEESDRLLKEMRDERITVTIDPSGWFLPKSAKLYARPVIGFDANGNCILGKWELIHDAAKNTHYKYTINGNYVMFGYTLDIRWGTDFPYSGIFWNDTSARVKTIYVDYGGGCRNASMKIKTTYTLAGDSSKTEKSRVCVDETNCSSHSEWKPDYVNGNADIKYLDEEKGFKDYGYL